MTDEYLTKPQQNANELRDFLAFLKNKEIGSFLEVGSKFGGMLWSVARLMPKGSRVVAVDLPNGPFETSVTLPSLKQCIAHLKQDGFDAHLIVGDSTDFAVVQRARDLGPYDCIFIDANHTQPYVRKDFANYGTRARIVCFHDVCWTEKVPPWRIPIEVPIVWAEIKKTYSEKAKFSEISHEKGRNGIGIIEWL